MKCVYGRICLIEFILDVCFLREKLAYRILQTSGDGGEMLEIPDGLDVFKPEWLIGRPCFSMFPTLETNMLRLLRVPDGRPFDASQNENPPGCRIHPAQRIGSWASSVSPWASWAA